MSENYLEVTFRHGRPLVAYYYLPRRPGDRSVKTRRVEPGMVIDFARGGRPIGIEITAPALVSVAAMNRVLRELGQPTLRKVDLSPLLAA
jgi:hypothetical protein